MSEALALRQLAAAIEYRDALLRFLDDEHCAEQLADTSGLKVDCYWASSCVGHKELMMELTKCIRASVPELLARVRASANHEVERCRVELAARATAAQEASRG